MNPLFGTDSSEYGRTETGSWPGDMKAECKICGEEIDRSSPLPSKNEAGEFIDRATGRHVIAHAQCGIDAGLELA